MSKIPTPAEHAERLSAEHKSARDALRAPGASRTDADILRVSQAGTRAAHARAAQANAERTPEQRAAGLAGQEELVSRAQRWFAGPDNAKGRHESIVLSPSQFQEWKAGGPVSGLPSHVKLSDPPL
jgi:hypothetical protein